MNALQSRLAKYAAITISIKARIPVAMLKYSANPPIVAPKRFAPRSSAGSPPLRNVVENIRPAKKIGSGTQTSDHKSLPAYGNANT